MHFRNFVCVYILSFSTIALAQNLHGHWIVDASATVKFIEETAGDALDSKSKAMYENSIESASLCITKSSFSMRAGTDEQFKELPIIEAEPSVLLVKELNGGRVTVQLTDEYLYIQDQEQQFPKFFFRRIPRSSECNI